MNNLSQGESMEEISLGIVDIIIARGKFLDALAIADIALGCLCLKAQ